MTITGPHSDRRGLSIDAEVCPLDEWPEWLARHQQAVDDATDQRGRETERKRRVEAAALTALGAAGVRTVPYSAGAELAVVIAGMPAHEAATVVAMLERGAAPRPVTAGGWEDERW